MNTKILKVCAVLLTLAGVAKADPPTEFVHGLDTPFLLLSDSLTLGDVMFSTNALNSLNVGEDSTLSPIYFSSFNFGRLNSFEHTSAWASTMFSYNFAAGSYNTISDTSSAILLGNTNSIYSWGFGSLFDSNTVLIGTGNQASNVYCSTVLGYSNELKSDNFTHYTSFTSVLGTENVVHDTYDAAVLGRGNTVTALNGGFVVGKGNALNATFAKQAQNVYVLGSNLVVNADTSSALDSLVVLGVNNASTVLAGGPSSGTSPLLILGNGTDSSTGRSNALVVQKSGATTISNRNYVAPTTGTPFPAQPETLVINGAAKVNGVVRVQPGGDLSMGDFTASNP